MKKNIPESRISNGYWLNVIDNWDEYGIDSKIKDKFFEVFDDGKFPVIQTVDDDNFDDILKVSKEMRNNIRGQDIGGLG